MPPALQAAHPLSVAFPLTTTSDHGLLLVEW